MVINNRLLGGIKRNERLFYRGGVYQTLDEFLTDWKDLQSSRYAYWNQKLMHVDFVAGMQLRNIDRAVQQGILFRAIRRDKDDSGNK